MNPTQSVRARHRAIVELFIAALFFGVTAFAAKRATRTLPGQEVALFRFLIGLGFVLLQSWVRRVPLRPKRYPVLAVRGILGGLSGLLYFLALSEIPVGTATLLNCTSPIFAAVFAWVALREAMSVPRVAALALAMAGVALVVIGEGRVLGSGAYAWQLLALASGITAGAAVTAIRAARKFNGPWEVFGAFNLFGILTTAPFALPTWRWPDGETWGWIAVMSLVAVCAQVLMTHALGYIEAATGAVISQLTVITTFVLGYAFDDQLITWLSLIGGALALTGVVWTARASTTLITRTPTT